ncbi:MAG: porin [Rhodoferax sp.]|uniref:porin n=1 Tax=Rhodoferax sp. TaxID=50421 RepID=UPI002731AAAF|nr:porin [Rhodoferax sp.]MDP1528305.1 porin [Rhodoferax sp.]MDP1945577.1 porin [Rhodoferax sp.]
MNKHSSSKGTVLGLRHVALASALCCAGLAQAQTDSSVTLYGLADVGITSVSGLKAGTVTQVASGIMEGSRWGIKGTEDMGGGYKTIFTLEARVELDTGASSNRPITGSQLSDRFSQAALLGLPGGLQPAVDAVDGLLATQYGVNVNNAVFDRQAFVGLITPVGAVLAGRQYTPAYETFATYDIMATQSALSAGQIVQFPAVFEIRTSNALAYRIVKDGISGAFMYAPGEVAGDSGKGRLLGINAGYKTDTFSVGLGYNTRNNELGEKSLTSTVLGASMNMGSSTISSLVAKIKDDHPNGLSAIAPALTPSIGSVFAGMVQTSFINAFKQDGTLFHIGYRNVTGPHTISVAYNRYDDKRPANADVKSYGAAYTYALSKRTDLNAVLVRFDNSANAQVAPGGNGYLGGVTASAGTDSTGVAFGIRHRF